MSAGNIFDVVILDYDGTLSDTRLAIAHCIERAFAKHGRAIPSPERIMPVVGKGLSLRETCSSLEPNLLDDPAAAEATVATYRTLYRDEGESLIKVFPGVLDALQQLRAWGVKCLVVSNKGAEAVRRSLDRHELSPLIELIFADQPGIPNKPDPALLTEHILPKFPHVPKRRMLMVGDSESDIRFANAAGIECCWVTYGFGDRQQCLALAPQYQIDSIEELPAVIRLPANRS